MMLSDLSFWIFIACAAALIISVGWLVKSYRDAKSAQYFFLREEAALRVKRLMFILVPLAVIVVFLGMRLYGPKEGEFVPEPPGTAVAIELPTATHTPGPSPTTGLTITATVTSPVETATPASTDMATVVITVTEETATTAPEVTTAPAPTEETAAISAMTATWPAMPLATDTATLTAVAETATITSTGSITGTVEPSPTPTATDTPIFSTVTPNPGATFKTIVFSRAITPDYKPRNPNTTFSPGDNYIYAFFEYSGMQNGVVWRHVWSRGAEQLVSESGVWEWGSDGRAYVFFSPVGGYTPGRYTVQVYVGDELKQSSDFTIR